MDLLSTALYLQEVSPCPKLSDINAEMVRSRELHCLNKPAGEI